MSKKNKKKYNKVKETFNKEKDLIKSFLDHPQNIIISAGLTPLLPFNTPMRRKLKKEGKPEGNNLAETSYNFVKYIMKKEVFEEWQYENFQKASFTQNIEELEIEDTGQDIPPEVIDKIIFQIPEIIKFNQNMIENEPDVDDPNNPAPNLPSDINLAPEDYAILLTYDEDMKKYLSSIGQTYSNNTIENAIKITKLLNPKLTSNWEYAFGDDIKDFWQNNRDEILGSIGALFVTIGMNPADDPISQGIGKGVSSTSAIIQEEAKKQTMLKTYMPLLIISVILLILLISKK
ncbi:hypothetical protein KBH77_04480 [Patescibacteria group bacterium]|nr:hypothetical protein [Patescibacteria group bacterium]